MDEIRCGQEDGPTPHRIIKGDNRSISQTIGMADRSMEEGIEPLDHRAPIVVFANQPSEPALHAGVHLSEGLGDPIHHPLHPGRSGNRQPH